MAMEQVAMGPRGTILPVTPVLAFSAWLVAQSKATPSVPTISIFLKLPEVIPQGGSTTICCSCQCDKGTFMLYKDGCQLLTLELHGSRAKFSISNATREDTGAYSCHYLGGGTMLVHRETLDVTVQEFRLPPPVLSVLPGQEVAEVASMIFRCTIIHSNAGCFLYLEGQVKALDFLPKERDDFNLSHVHKVNGGRYSRQCFTKVALVEWSPVSQPVDLVVKGETSPQPQPALSSLGI
ncbi:leukocyte immunoglobulin-like receptor subfamily A member 1 [Athene cunicularia]|uniref:leukocyte immunoglobulin-like receptor subfamily A member 1 n=1 Tax=Athene cunicularia TaxID=194338 RepID=UPI000EF68473|nr:leukocyte immunoglobulin-like receptor subfamily A member 1 [Athene cunicularia]